MIDPTNITIEALNAKGKNTMAEHLAIEFCEIGTDYLVARMPVDYRTHQPLGMLNGGAAMALAETVGSMAANLVIDRSKWVCLGLDINGNHVRPARSGFVYGTARPLHIGRKTQVWEIRVTDEAGQLVNISRLTMAVIPVEA